MGIRALALAIKLFVYNENVENGSWAGVGGTIGKL